jgi:hypothetical protein
MRHVLGRREINTYKLSVVKPEGKRQLGRCQHGWEDSIKMDHMKQGRMIWTGFN